MLENRLNNCGCVDYDAADAVIKEVEMLAYGLKKAIMEAKDEIKVSGKCYYVSEKNGDDGNDGLSKEKPIKTTAKLGETELFPGDGVFFERGGIYRNGFTCSAGVTYAAYGEGRKPRIYGSPENGADPDKWSLVDGTKNIWKYSVTMSDVGVIIFDEGRYYSVKKIPSYIDGRYVHRYNKDVPFDIKKDMNRDLCHFCKADFEVDGNGNPLINDKTGEIYLRCDRGNPGEIFDSIEFANRPNVIRVGGKPNVHIDNLAVMYGGCHGVGAGTVDGLTVTNCEIGWIGGAIQFYFGDGDRKGDVVRYGNGIEIYGGCDGFLVDHNYIYQCYDAGVTHQLSSGGDRDCFQKNVTYSNNLIEYCTYNYEYFLGNPSGANCIRYQKNIKVVDNIMRYAGFGFGEQRPSSDTYFPAAHIKGWNHANYLEKDYVVEGNIFDRARDMVIHCCAIQQRYLPAFNNNIYIQYNGEGNSNFGTWGLSSASENIPYDENVKSALEEKGIENGAGIYYARRDWLWELEDFLPKHERT